MVDVFGLFLCFVLRRQLEAEVDFLLRLLNCTAAQSTKPTSITAATAMKQRAEKAEEWRPFSNSEAAAGLKQIDLSSKLLAGRCI